jgi:hypothetical protein
MPQAVDRRELGVVGSTGFLVSVGSIVTAAGVGLAFLRYFVTEPAWRGIEGAMAGAALGAVVAVPGILALLAQVDRPWLLMPAAILLFPLSILSFVLLPLLIAAALLLVSFGRRSTGRTTQGGRAALMTLTVIVLLTAAAVTLFVHEDPRSYTTATGGGSTSDVITMAESLISLSLSSAAIAAGWLLAPLDPLAPKFHDPPVT